MAYVSVTEAAQQLGVGVSRIHKRIRDGSLHARRIGAQWVIDEVSLLQVAERTRPGRPYSARSTWAIIATAEADETRLSQLSGTERSRARSRLQGLLEQVRATPASEVGVRQLASTVRLLFRKRAQRLLFRAAPLDLVALRDDSRWDSLLSSSISQIASETVEGYADAGYAEELERDYLLVPTVQSPNVILRVLPPGQNSYRDSVLLTALDLADGRDPRQELRAAQLLSQLAGVSGGIT